MRIALVAVNFWPEATGIGPYVRAYADLLHGAGHSVEVITSRPHYPEWRPRESDDSTLPYPVRRCHHYIPARPTALRRAAFELSFAFAVTRALRALERPDLALAVSPPLFGALAASRFARQRRIPFGLVVQDVVSAAPGQIGGFGGAARALAAVERAVVRSATLVGVVSDAFRSRVEALGAAPQRVHLVRNWPLSERAFPSRPEARLRAGFLPEEIVCVHAGNMGAKQGLEVVVEAARLAARTGAPVRFVLIGDGNQRERLEALARDITTLEFRPVQPEERLYDALAGADALLLTQRASVTDMALPSKITTYVRSGTPIVAAVAADSAAGRELARYGAALLTPPERPRELLDAVMRVSGDFGLRARLLAGARAYHDAVLNRERLEAAFLSFVERCAAAPPGAAPATAPVSV
jgi:glycosyltransferase involved in cell wall biosynthesis